MKKTLLILQIILLVIMSVQAQTDTEFWFAAPRLTPNHNNKDIEINIITYEQAAVVTIAQPAAPETSFNKTVSIPAWSYHTVKLGGNSGPLPNVETLFGAVRNTGFLITSDVPVQAYYASTTNNSEVYSLKGRNALGVDFIVPSQTDRPNSTGSYSGGKNSVEIVAAQDNTEVEITPSNNCEGGIKKGETFTVVLNKGQTYAISAQGASAVEHLHNSRIKSNKPIAVNYTDDTVSGPGADLLGDQIIPISKTGNNYIIIANYKKAIGNNLTEKAYIFPTEDNTTIYANSEKQITLNIGEDWSYDLIAQKQDAVQITSDKPILVLHVTSYDNELGCAVLPPLDCTGSREIAYKSAFGTPYFDVITKKENIDAFTVNGNSFLLPPQVFQPVNDDDIWYYAVRPISINGLIHVQNSKGYFHVGAFDVDSHTCSLGYFSNFNIISLTASSNNAYYYVGDEIHFKLKETTDIVNYYWEGPNGFVSYDAEPTIENVDESTAGRYIVSASHRDGCPIEPDTFYVHVFPQSITENHSICYGNELKLTAPGEAPYLWNTGATTAEITVSPTSAAEFSVISRREGFENRAQFDLPHYYRVEVLDSLQPQVRGDLEICHGEAILEVVGNYDSYLWSTGETTASITVKDAGDYSVWVTQGDCSGTGYHRVDAAPALQVEMGSTASVCYGEELLNLPFSTRLGLFGHYDLEYSNSAISAGFENQYNLTPEEGELLFQFPSDVRPGVYKLQLTFHEATCGSTQVKDLELMVKYPSSIIEQRWNDVLGVLNEEYNGGYIFSAYQWYKNDVAIEGANKSYMLEEPWLNSSAKYAVLLTDESGISVFSCDYRPLESTESKNISGKIVQQGGYLQIENNAVGGVATLWTLSGVLAGRFDVEEGTIQLPAPQSSGFYLLELPGGERHKIVVR